MSVETPAVSDGLAEAGVTLSRIERGYWHESARRLSRDRVALVSAGVIALFTFFAFAAPLISDYVTHFRPTDQDLLNTFAGPSGEALARDGRARPRHADPPRLGREGDARRLDPLRRRCSS